MKIALYGDLSPGGGGWCYAQTLREIGHDVLEFGSWQCLEFYRTRLFWRALRKGTHSVLERHRLMHCKALEEAIRGYSPDAVIILKGLHVSRDQVREFQKGGAWVVNINHDDFFSQNPLNWSRVQRSSVGAYDYIFTTREVNVAELQPFNRRVEFFPFAYSPRIHRPVPIPPQEHGSWDVDIVFVGTWAPHRAWLLEELVRRITARFAIYGGFWHKISRKSPLRPFVRFREVMMDDMAKAFAGAKVSLGFLRKENRDDYTQRTFEIPACGGVLVAERTVRHQKFYREGTEAEFFDADDPKELAEKVRSLLSDPSRREQMRSSGRAALLAQKHTYRDRLERLLELYSNRRHGREECFPGV